MLVELYLGPSALGFVGTWHLGLRPRLVYFGPSALGSAAKPIHSRKLCFTASESPLERRLFLATEAVDYAHLEAVVVLEGAAIGGAKVAGRNAEGEVGVEVEVHTAADGECRSGAGGGPETEIRGGDAFRGAVKLADGHAAQGE